METVAVPDGDGKLLALFAELRDESAFTALLNRHGQMVMSVCRSVLGNTADSEEATQAVFLTLAQKAAIPSVQSHLVGWLHRVAWYISTRAVAARETRRRHEKEAARMKREIGSSRKEEVDEQRLHASLANLPEKYRAAIILHYVEGRSHQEAAQMAGCSIDALAVRLHRGREMLRGRLNKRGLTVSSAALAGTFAGQSVASMSPHFVLSTARAAMALTTGSLPSQIGVSGGALALADEAMRMLLRAKIKALATVATLLIVLGVALPALITSTRRADRQAVGTAVKAIEPTTNSTAAAQVITGLIKRVTETSIDIFRQNGETVIVPANASTAIQIDGRQATLAELKNDMSAAAFINSGQPATEVRAFTDATLRTPK